MKAGIAIVLLGQSLVGLSPAEPVWAQSQHEGHADHGPVAPAEVRVPMEAGQAAFAAIAEIVAILADDPATDWSRVDIGALQAHLMDMDAVVRATLVTARSLPDGLEMRIGADDGGFGPVQRMVPAHAPVLARETGWRSEIMIATETLTWQVRAADPDAIARIQALGFYGLMATGAHHQAHHLAIARGATIH